MLINCLDRPECQMRREYIFDGRSILACDAQSNPGVINFTWFKGNKTISEVTSTMPSASTDIIDKHASVVGSKQSAVLVLADSDVEAYYCIATNAIGPSNACKLQVQQIASGMSFINYLVFRYTFCIFYYT
jgi:hypothetical protein